MPNGRGLTTGETALARTIYGAAIEYSRVRVHDGKFVALQPFNSGMTPRGEIYVSGAYRLDYAMAEPLLKAFFIHEMAHVYQFQMKVLNPIAAALGAAVKHGFAYDRAYFYTLAAHKDLLDYGVEQQAQIIEDYYRVRIAGLPPKHAYMKNTLGEVIGQSLFERVLARFLKDPKYAKHRSDCRTRKIGKTTQTFCTRVLAQ